MSQNGWKLFFFILRLKNFYFFQCKKNACRWSMFKHETWKFLSMNLEEFKFYRYKITKQFSFSLFYFLFALWVLIVSHFIVSLTTTNFKRYSCVLGSEPWTIPNNVFHYITVRIASILKLAFIIESCYLRIYLQINKKNMWIIFFSNIIVIRIIKI